MLVLLSSCKHAYYLPNVQNVPLFREKNEYRLLVAEEGSGEITATEVQAAYSVSSHWAVTADFLHATGGQDTSKNKAHGNYLEGAAGYYIPSEKYGIFELYGGFGAATQHHQYGKADSVTTYNKTYENTADLFCTKYFLQASYGVSYHVFDIAFSARICRLEFSRINNQISPGRGEYDNLDQIAQNKTSYLLEPAITIRLGWKYVKGQLQVGFSDNLSHPQLAFEHANISLGLYIAIAKRYWHSDAKI